MTNDILLRHPEGHAHVEEWAWTGGLGSCDTHHPHAPPKTLPPPSPSHSPPRTETHLVCKLKTQKFLDKRVHTGGPAAESGY